MLNRLSRVRSVVGRISSDFGAASVRPRNSPPTMRRPLLPPALRPLPRRPYRRPDDRRAWPPAVCCRRVFRHADRTSDGCRLSRGRLCRQPVCRPAFRTWAGRRRSSSCRRHAGGRALSLRPSDEMRSSAGRAARSPLGRRGRTVTMVAGFPLRAFERSAPLEAAGACASLRPGITPLPWRSASKPPAAFAAASFGRSRVAFQARAAPPSAKARPTAFGLFRLRSDAHRRIQDVGRAVAPDRRARRTSSGLPRLRPRSFGDHRRVGYRDGQEQLPLVLGFSRLLPPFRLAWLAGSASGSAAG